jgi:hypothetical protein
MTKNSTTSQGLIYHKWFRVTLSLVIAFIFALIILLIPISLSATIHVPLLSSPGAGSLDIT